MDWAYFLYTALSSLFEASTHHSLGILLLVRHAMFIFVVPMMQVYSA